MGIGCNISDLTAKLGYSFCDITYLQTALTHSSYSNEMRSRGFRAESNESLEFLGDAVLQIVISEVLYDKFRKLGEGTLTKYRQSLVCEKTLSAIAEGIELGKYLNVGTGEEVMNIRQRPKVLADCFEMGVLPIKAKNKLRLLPALNIPMELLERAVAVIKAVAKGERI